MWEVKEVGENNTIGTRVQGCTELFWSVGNGTKAFLMNGGHCVKYNNLQQT
jgi:hypothetical protein